MQLRKAKACELDTIYEMGFDVWGSGLPYEEYLSLCRQSKKYQLGIWYVLVDKEILVSSAIVYRDGFGLKTGCFGIGSLSTPPKHRQKGYASKLVTLLKDELFEQQNCQALYLHSDINHEFYTKLSFKRILDTDCLLYSKDEQPLPTAPPNYF
ncbi:GNAT family N-acetyltransferase [Vibrio sp. OCN044]|uniref:GNAT family N-acetyltransferase n=1 Tax=Vibrio tetraodonis subsp. pristinus TaxID=2695891 RepID=A0A6L8LU37_9VIBR|nr:GNAT family N-acetyltransferase [Vibrio tetraodonis]MYM58993.1 GNAT family N-acetyltransferase [Vibrio tetraodonis subsp. pristinus]